MQLEAACMQVAWIVQVAQNQQVGMLAVPQQALEAIPVTLPSKMPQLLREVEGEVEEVRPQACDCRKHWTHCLQD